VVEHVKVHATGLKLAFLITSFSDNPAPIIVRQRDNLQSSKNRQEQPLQVVLKLYANF
jgi:hypothetical protein